MELLGPEAQIIVDFDDNFEIILSLLHKTILCGFRLNHVSLAFLMRGLMMK